MTYAELKTQIRHYLQRTDVTNQQIDEAMERARVKIAADLRTRSNIRSIDILVNDGVGSDPGDIVEFLHVKDENNCTLTPVAPNEFWSYFDAGGSRALYYMLDSQFLVAPKITGTITCEYYYAPGSVIGNDNNTIASILDELYIPLVCSDLFAGFHNWDAATYHELRYQGLVERRNRQWRQRVQPMRRVRSYNSNPIGAL